MPPIDDNSGQFTEMLRITIDLSGFRAELDKALTVYKDFIADLGKVKAPTVGTMATPDLSKAIGEIKQTLASLSSDINTTVAGQFQVLGEQVERIYTTLGIQTTQAENKLTEVTRSASAERVAIVEEEAKKRAAAISQIVSRPIPPQQQAEEIRQTLTPQMQERVTAGQIEAVLVQGQAIKTEAESEAKTVEEAEAAKLNSREATAHLVTEYLTQQATQTVNEAEAGVKITAEAEAQKAKLYEQTLQTVRRVLAEQNALIAEGGQVSAQRTAEALLQAVPAEAQANVTPKEVESVVVQASESTTAQEAAAAKEKAVIQGTLAVTKDVNAQKVADSQQAAERVTAFILQQELIAKDGISAGQSQITQTIQRNTNEQIRAVELGSERQMQIFQQLIDRRLTMESAANALHGTLSTEAQENISVAQLRGMLEQSDRLVKQEAEDEVTVREQSATSKNKVDETSLKAFARYTDEQLKLAEKLNTERVKLAESAAKQTLDIEEGLQRSIKTLRESQAAVGQPVAFASQPRDVTVPEADANERAIEVAQQTIPAFTAAQEQINEVRSRLGAEATAESNRQNKAQLASITESTQENLALVNKAVSDKLKAKQSGDRAALKDAQDSALAENKILDEAAVAQVELQMRSTAKLIEIGDNLTEARQRQAKLQAELQAETEHGVPMVQPVAVPNSTAIEAALKAEQEQIAKLQAERAELEQKAAQQELSITQTLEEQKAALRQKGLEAEQQRLNAEVESQKRADQQKLESAQKAAPQPLVDNVISNREFITPQEVVETQPPRELPVPKVEPVKEATEQTEQIVKTSAENVTRAVSEQNAAQLANTRTTQEQEQALVQQAEKHTIQLHEETAKRRKEIDEELASRNQNQSELQAQLIPTPVLPGRPPSTKERAGEEDLQKASADEMSALAAAQLAFEEGTVTSQSRMTADEVQQANKRLDIAEKELAGKVKAREQAEVVLSNARKTGEEAELKSIAELAKNDEKARQAAIEAEEKLGAERVRIRENIAKQIERGEQELATTTKRIAEEEQRAYAKVQIGDTVRDPDRKEVRAREEQLQASRESLSKIADGLNKLQADNARIQQGMTEEDVRQYGKQVTEFEKSLNKEVSAATQAGEKITAVTKNVNERTIDQAHGAALKQQGTKSIGREALEGLVGGAERANQVLDGTLGITSGIAGNIARMTVSMSGWILAWQAAQVIINGVVHLLEFIPQHIEAGFQALAQDQEKAVELQAVIAQTTHLADGFVANFRAAGQAAPEVIDRLREKAAELNVDFDKLVTTFKVLSESGAPGLTHNLQEVVDLTGLIQLSFKAVTRDQEDERKIAQEIPALLSGQVQENARVLELLHLSRSEWLAILNSVRDTRDLLPVMQERLQAFAEAAKEMPDTWASLQRQFALFERTVNEDLAAPLFHELIGLAKELNQWLIEHRDVIRQYAALIGQEIAEVVRLVGAFLQLITATSSLKEAVSAVVILTGSWFAAVDMTLASLIMVARIIAAIANGNLGQITEAWNEYKQEIDNTSEALLKLTDLQLGLSKHVVDLGIGSVSLDAKNGSEALDSLGKKFQEVQDRAVESRNTLSAVDIAHSASREDTATKVNKSYDDEISKIRQLAEEAKKVVEQDNSLTPEDKSSRITQILEQRGQAEETARKQQYGREESGKRGHLLTMEQMADDNTQRIQNKYKQLHDDLAANDAVSAKQKEEQQKRLHAREAHELDDYANELRAKARQISAIPNVFGSLFENGFGGTKAQLDKAVEMEALADKIQGSAKGILQQDTGGSDQQRRETSAEFFNDNKAAQQYQQLLANTKTKIDDIKLAESERTISQGQASKQIIAAYQAEIASLAILKDSLIQAANADHNLNDKERADVIAKIKLDAQRDENSARAALAAARDAALSRELSAMEEKYHTAVERIKEHYQSLYIEIDKQEKTHQISARAAADELSQLHGQEAKAVKDVADQYDRLASRLGNSDQVKRFKDSLGTEKINIGLTEERRGANDEIRASREAEKKTIVELQEALKGLQDGERTTLELERQRYNLGLESATEYAQKRYQIESKLLADLITAYEDAKAKLHIKDPDDPEINRINEQIALTKQKQQELTTLQPGEAQAAQLHDAEEYSRILQEQYRLQIEQLQLDNQFELNAGRRLQRQREILATREKELSIAEAQKTQELATVIAQGGSQNKVEGLATELLNIQTQFKQLANERGAAAASRFNQSSAGELPFMRGFNEFVGSLVGGQVAQKEQIRLVNQSNVAIQNKLIADREAIAAQIKLNQAQVAAGTAVKGTEDKIKELQSQFDNLNNVLKGDFSGIFKASGLDRTPGAKELPVDTLALLQHRAALQHLIDTYRQNVQALDSSSTTNKTYKTDTEALTSKIKDLTAQVESLTGKIKNSLGPEQNGQKPVDTQGLGLQGSPELQDRAGQPTAGVKDPTPILGKFLDGIGSVIPGISAVKLGFDSLTGSASGLKTGVDDAGNAVSTTADKFRGAASIVAGLTSIAGDIGGEIKGLHQAKDEGGTTGEVGYALGPNSASGKLLGQIPIVGPLINAVGGALQMIGDMFTSQARKIARSIEKELSNIDFQFSLTGNLSQYIQSIEAEKEKAIQQLSGTKGGQKELDKILDTLNRQLAQAINQAQQLKQEFNRGYLALRTHNQELGQFITQMYSIFEQANKALDAGESKAQVQQFVNLSILQLKLQAQDEFLKGEQTAVEDAIKLNDLQQQRIQLIQQEKMSEFDLLTKDAVQRQIPEAIKVGQELAQKRLDFQKQLTDINNQIQLTQDKVNAEKTIYSITSDISTLHRQDEELQRYFLNEEVQKLSTAKALMEGIVTDAKGNITLSPLLDQLLGIFGFGLGGKNAGVLKGRYGFGYNPATNPNTIGYPQQPVYSDLIPPGTPGVPTQKPLPNTLSYPITYPYAPGVQPITTQSVQTAVTQGTTAGIQQAPQFTQLRNGLQGTTAATGNLSTHTIALTGVVRELNTTLLGMTLRGRLSSPAGVSVAAPLAGAEMSPAVLQQVTNLTNAIHASGTLQTEAYRKLTSCIDQLTVAVNNLKLVNPLQIPRVQTPFVTSQQMTKSVTINGGINVSAHTNASPQTIAATVADELYRNLRYGSSF